MGNKVNIRYTRRIQVADFEPLEYSVSAEFEGEPGESNEHLAARCQSFVGDLFNQVEQAVLDDHDAGDRAVPLSTMEVEDDIPERSSPPRRRS